MNSDLQGAIIAWTQSGFNAAPANKREIFSF